MILDRIKQFIDYKDISVSAFEKSIGMSNASFGRSLKNKGAIGTDKLEKILNVYPDINLQWLLTGKGSMISSPISIYKEEVSNIASEPPVEYKSFDEIINSLKNEIKVLQDRINDKESLIRSLEREVASLEKMIALLEKND